MAANETVSTISENSFHSFHSWFLLQAGPCELKHSAKAESTLECPGVVEKWLRL